MVFFPELEKPIASERDILRVRKLRAAISESLGVIQRQWIKNGAIEIARLRKSLKDENSGARLDRAINWYCKHIQSHPDPFRVISICHFRKVFGIIEQKASRDVPPDLPISDEAREVASYVKGLRWPKNSKEQLELTVQLTLNEYAAFRKALYKRVDDNKLLDRFREWLLGRMPPPYRFATSWLKRTNAKVKDWKNWSGNLVARAMKFDSQAFKDELTGWGRQYSPRYSIQLAKELYEEIKDEVAKAKDGRKGKKNTHRNGNGQGSPRRRK